MTAKRRKMETLANKFNKNVYFTQNPINYDDRYEGCKYFFH